jgi:putative spermidine/putrescine transport system ATP-binding protein
LTTAEHRAGHALTLASIVHRFGTFVAVSDVTLDFAPGELVALLGPSGCGKTTLLRIIAGFIGQSEGDVRVDGASISHLPPNRRNIGIVFQNYALFPHMTVAENIAYGLQARGTPSSVIAPVVDEMLGLVQMAAFRERFPRQLSGGQQQRIALARCLAVRPSILLLDEPFGALDKNLRLDMQIEIKNLQRQSGITTVLVTHDQEEALGMADRIAVLRRGRVEQFASPTEIYDRPATLFVNSFVGTTNLLAGELVNKTADGAHVRLAAGPVIDCATETACAVGDPVLVSVRPERFAMLDAAAEGSIPGTVRAVLPLGPSTVFEVALGDGTPVKVIQDRTDATSSIEPGRAIHLGRVSNNACAIFARPEDAPA